jgi:Holliday junction resolvase RusA-like endonuclease
MEYRLPGFKPKPKARPQGGRGHFFIPKQYQDWKRSIREYLWETYHPVPTGNPCGIRVEILGPNRSRGDVDNLLGGIFDAIQSERAKGDVRAQQRMNRLMTPQQQAEASPGCLVWDDKQFVAASIWWTKDRKYGIRIEMEEI